MSQATYCVFTVACAAVVILAYKVFGLKAIYPLLAVAGLTFAFTFYYFAPIDEENHFAYVRFLQINHRMPVLMDYTPSDVLAMQDRTYPNPSTRPAQRQGMQGRMYESQHPPLFYMLAALVPGGLILQFYLLRVLGVLALVITAVILVKTYELAVKNGMIPPCEPLFYRVLVLLLLSPGPMRRMTTVSNLILAMPLCSLLLYMLVKLGTEEKTTLPSHILPIALISGAAVMTHALAVVVAAAAGVSILVKTRSLKRCVQFAAICGVIIAPWIVFNLHHYGSLTAFAATRPILEKYVNPAHTPHGLIWLCGQLRGFGMSYWVPEDAGMLKPWVAKMAIAMGVVAALALAVGLVKAADAIRYKRNPWLVTVMSATGLANLLLVCGIEGFTWHGSVLGRYLYLTLPAAVFMFYISMMEAQPRVRAVLSTVAMIFAAILWATVFVNMLYPWRYL
jgi:hypothetical protein